MVKISVQQDLREEWQPVLDRQLNLAMSRMRDQLGSLRVRFGASLTPGQETAVYRCEIRGRAMTGKIYRHTARSTDGTTAIADALARISRAVSRDRRQPPSANEHRPLIQ